MSERKQAVPAAPDAVLRALADPHRRKILRLVQHDELPAGRIAASFTHRGLPPVHLQGHRAGWEQNSAPCPPPAR